MVLPADRRPAGLPPDGPSEARGAPALTAFRIGYTVPDGEEVLCDPQHLGITGLTQMSGKTTSLEAFMERAGLTAIVFRTSRGELGFHGARSIAPYFRERTDWRFVEGLISAHLMEKAKFYRADLIRLTRGARSLFDVHQNVLSALGKARSGSFPEKVLTELNEYLQEIRLALDSVRFAPAPNLSPTALSVMDLEGLSPAVQQLVVAATVDWLMEGHLDGPVIVVLPEARDFIPEDRRTPAKLSLENLIRKGARVRRYLWVDSQSLTGLDMDVMRSVGTWLFGRQTLDLECRRVAKMAPGRKVRPDDVKGLGIGQFFLIEGEEVRKVYVQPAWMNTNSARSVARGETRPDQVDTDARRERERLREQELMDEKEKKAYEERIKKAEDDNAQLRKVIENRDKEWQQSVDRLEAQVKSEHDRAEANAKAAAANAIVRIGGGSPSPETLAAGARALDAGAALLDAAAKGKARADVHVFTEAPSLTVHVREVRVETSGEDLRGRIAVLIHDGFFDTRKRQNAVAAELLSRAWGNYTGQGGRATLGKELHQYTEWRFFDYDVNNGYQVLDEAKARVRVAREAVPA